MAQTDRAKLDRLLAKLPSLCDILRGSLLHRTTFHSQGCSKCASGRGHPQWVLNVNYPGGKNRQISLRRDQLPQVRLWLRNHRQVKKTLEAICELNQLSLRAASSPRPATRKKGRDSSAPPSTGLRRRFSCRTVGWLVGRLDARWTRFWTMKTSWRSSMRPWSDATPRAAPAGGWVRRQKSS